MIDGVEVKWALLCDSASAGPNGKLDIQGVFDRIGAKRFPARHKRLTIVFKMECPASEYDQTRQLKICLLEADGKRVLEMEAELHIQRPPSLLLGIQQIVEIEDLVFPKAGDYRFDIVMDKHSMAQLPVVLVKIGENGFE